MEKKFYITTPVYYVNDKPHIGHAYTSVAADVLARFHRLQNEEVFFLMGTDEHGLKIQKKAEEAGKDPQTYADEIAGDFKNLWENLDIKYDNFIRTTDEKHKTAVQKVLQTLFDKGVIVKGEYEGLYCVGCEQIKNENDLVNGRCPDHDTDCEIAIFSK
ncbi:MAG: class I tRNA ligase family protein [Candidatus Moranbacteria bacterium]|nr:class I tRNA ligase family protein [Candidatus Moranbacteria bacterium]